MPRTPGTHRDDPRTYFNLVSPTTPWRSSDRCYCNPQGLAGLSRQGAGCARQLASTNYRTAPTVEAGDGRSEPVGRCDAGQRQPGRDDGGYRLCQHEPRARLVKVARRGPSAECKGGSLQLAEQPRRADLL
jgi:hypothetical protein